MSKKPEALIFHCSAIDQGNVSAIRKWHVNHNGWRDIGYSAIILNGKEDNKPYNKERDGIMENGRGFDTNNTVDPDEIGAHTLGYNRRGFAFCLVGKDKFTMEQFKTAILWSKSLLRLWPDLEILGHYETPRTNKTCPNFGMNEFRKAVESNGSLEASIKLHLKPWLKNLY